jgi:hypothetical protein
MRAEILSLNKCSWEGPIDNKLQNRMNSKGYFFLQGWIRFCFFRSALFYIKPIKPLSPDRCDKHPPLLALGSCALFCYNYTYV